MSKNKRRFVGKAIAGVGWRIWNKKGQKWWGNFFSEYPDELLDELNGLKRTERLTELQRQLKMFK